MFKTFPEILPLHKSSPTYYFHSDKMQKRKIFARYSKNSTPKFAKQHGTEFMNVDTKIFLKITIFQFAK